MITLDVHAKDVVQEVIDHNRSDVSDFEWQAQLRYYWQDNNLWAKMLNCALKKYILNHQLLRSPYCNLKQ